MSAACCSVRVTEGCGRPSAVPTKGAKGCPDHEDQVFVVSSVIVYDQRLLALRLLELLQRWERPDTHIRAALRAGTAAVLRRSASLDCAPVSPLLW